MERRSEILHQKQQIPSQQDRSYQTLGVKLTSTSGPDGNKTIATPQLQTASSIDRETNRYTAKQKSNSNQGPSQRTNQFINKKGFNVRNNDHRASPQTPRERQETSDTITSRYRQMCLCTPRNKSRARPHPATPTHPPLRRSPHRIPNQHKHKKGKNLHHTHTLSRSVHSNGPQMPGAACWLAIAEIKAPQHPHPALVQQRHQSVWPRESPLPGPTRPAPGKRQVAAERRDEGEDELRRLVRRRLGDGKHPKGTLR